MSMSQNQKSKNMFRHNLKIAFRNLRKYKTQNIISIIGLAVGFVCFAFSALWIRYEMSYDNFHPNADRIYRVNTSLFKWDTMAPNSSELRNNPYQLANWLKTNLSEIEDASGIQLFTRDIYTVLQLDYSFCNIFNLPIPENFFIAGLTDKPIAVIPELDNEESAKNIKEQLFNWDVQTTIPRWKANTNITFNVAAPITYRNTEEQLKNWRSSSYHIYILVRNGIDIQALKNKLDKVEIPEMWSNPVSLVLTPIRQLRYKDPTGNIQSEIKFNHIRIFAIAGLLVILSSLFNHLTMYVTRVRMRLRELVLRKVNGATDFQIAVTLFTDFMLVIFVALFAGLMLTLWLLPTFKEYAAIGGNNISIYSELFLYTVLLIACGLICSCILVMYFRKQALNESIRGNVRQNSGNMFRKASLLIQFIISLGLMFCSIVFIKQIRFLHRVDLGINRHNVAAVSLHPQYTDQLMQIPGIIDVLPVFNISFLRNMILSSGTQVTEKDGEKISHTTFSIWTVAHFFDFFGIKFIEGAEFSNESDDNYVINNTAMNVLKDVFSEDRYVTGVVHDFYIDPVKKTLPVRIGYSSIIYNGFQATAYRYEEGMRQQTQQSIIEWIHNVSPNRRVNFTYMEDIFEEHFKSERALLKLLSFMTLACILIAVFGVYSLTSLSCQQRRKEIAIRKVYGAEVLDIMNIFFMEYLILLAMAALVAFPAGYIIMKRWLEGYVKQTSMDAWLFIAIFLIVFAVIVFSIFSMVWKAANQNPAEVVKSE